MAAPLLSWNLRPVRGVTGSDSARVQIGYWNDYFQNEGINSLWEVADFDTVNSNYIMLKPKTGAYVNDRVILSVSDNSFGYVLDSSNSQFGTPTAASTYRIMGIYCQDAALATVPDLTTGPAVSGGYTGGGQSSAAQLYRAVASQNDRMWVVDSEDCLLLCTGDSASTGSVFCLMGRACVAADDTLLPLLAGVGNEGSVNASFWLQISGAVSGYFLPRSNPAGYYDSFITVKRPSDGAWALCRRINGCRNTEELRSVTNDEILRAVTIGTTAGSSNVGQLRQIKIGRKQVDTGLIATQAGVKLATYVSSASLTQPSGDTLYFSEDY